MQLIYSPTALITPNRESCQSLRYVSFGSLFDPLINLLSRAFVKHAEQK